MRKKVVFQRCATIALASVMTVGGLLANIPMTTLAAESSTNTNYGLADSIQEGNILHCFDWKYTDIKAELPNIAAAGFTSIQTSPAQDSSYAGEKWYMLYQPTDFAIHGNGLGTKEELADLCQEAEKYGINIVVDVVANHLRGDGNTYNGVTSALARNYHGDYWHDGYYVSGVNVDWTNRYQVTHCNIGMWDLNSENNNVAYYVANYIDQLGDLGVDGIRWDAAKHISLPSENCNFWAIVTSVDNLYNYGEILSGPNNGGSNNDAYMKEYTNYMSVTDDEYGNSVCRAIKNNRIEDISTTGNYVNRGVSKNKMVYWAESHDTYANNDSNGTQWLSQNIIDRAYAIVGSQKDATALYYSRPYSTNKETIYIGQKGSTHFTSPEVAAVNQFHNAMVGQAEYDVKDTNQDVYAVCRGNGTDIGGASIVLTNNYETNKNVSIKDEGGLLPSGTYKDLISGNTFTVSGGMIYGTVGSTGIAVIYKKGPVVEGPSISVNQESTNFTDSLTVTFSIDADSYTIKANGIENNQLTQTYNTTTEVVVTAVKNGQSLTQNYTYTLSSNPITNTITVYFTNNYNWNDVYAYTWGGTTNTAGWPGTKMTYVKQNEYNQAVYKIEIASDVKGLIFTNGNGTQTVDITSGIQNSTGYYISGSGTKCPVGRYIFQ